MMYNINENRIINNVIHKFINENIFNENEDDNDNSKESQNNDSLKNGLHPEGKKKKKKFRKNALKAKNGLRKDFDVEDDENYNQGISDDEQRGLSDFLLSGYVNIAKVAQDVYPDHTPEGAQSQLLKELKGEHADSGYKYHLKNKTAKKLYRIIAQHLSF